MKTFDFVGRHKARGLRIGRHVMGLICDQLLRFSLDHVFQEFVCEFLVFTRGGDHQVIDPAGRVLLRNRLSGGKSCLFQVRGVQGPSHCHYDFMVFEQIGQLTPGGPHLPNVGLQCQQLLLHGLQFLIAGIQTPLALFPLPGFAQKIEVPDEN